MTRPSSQTASARSLKQIKTQATHTHTCKNTHTVEWLTQACCRRLAKKVKKALSALTDSQGEQMHAHIRSHLYILLPLVQVQIQSSQVQVKHVERGGDLT